MLNGNDLTYVFQNKETEEIISQLKRVTELREELDKIIKDLINKGDNMKYFRIHTSDIAYKTQQPLGLFVAVWRLPARSSMRDRICWR